MKTEVKIIRSFIENKKPMTIREIAHHINADYKITHLAIQRLLSKQIIKTQTIGNSILCSLDDNTLPIEMYQAEYERKEKILKHKNIHQLYKEILSKINTTFFIMLIFGSYAKNKQTKTSDIDIIFISNDKDFEQKLSDILSLIPLKIHNLVFTEEEFIRMKDAKKPNVVKEAIEHNVILYGIETYYRLKHA